MTTTSRIAARTSAIGTRWIIPVALAAVVGWFGFLAWHAVHYQSFGSPDEAANSYMAKTFARTGEFRAPTGLSLDQLSRFHPRSLSVVGSDLLPGSFLGFILIHGLLEKFGSAAPSI